MRNSNKNFFAESLTVFFGIVASLLIYRFLPVFSKNIMFLLAMPLVILFFVLMFVNAQITIVILLFSRVMLDSILNLTKVSVDGGASMGIGGLINLFVIVFSLYLFARTRKTLNQPLPALGWTVFLLVCAFAILYTPAMIRERAVRLLLNLLTYAAVFFIPYYVIRTIEQKKFYLKMLLYSSILPLVFAYFSLLKGGVVYGEDEGMRIQGSFTHPNILAFYLVLIVTIVFYTLKNPQFNLKPAQKRFLVVYMFIVFMLLILTKTRSAWIACWWMFLIYGILKEKKYLIIALFLPALFLLFPVVSSRIKDVFHTTESYGKGVNSFAWRVKLWESSIPWIKERLLTGHGLTSFEFFSPVFSPFRNEHNPAHNIYVELLFETGLFGVFSFLLIYLGIMKKFFLKMFSLKDPQSKTYAIIFAYILSYLLVCSSDNLLYYLVFNWYFWFFIGVVTSSLKIENGKDIGDRAVI